MPSVKYLPWGHMTKAKVIAHVTCSIFLDPLGQTCQFSKDSCLCLHSNSSHARDELCGNVGSLF